MIENEIIRDKLLASLLLFTSTFYKLRNGREFNLSHPVCRECHYITLARELTSCFKLELIRLLINIPPGMAKSTMLKYFVAWCFAHYSDCQFLYISYSHSLASEHTSDIKGIMELRQYKELFGVEISRESSAKDNFKTTTGGSVKAFGSGGAITGQNAGLPGLKRFSGACLMDDMHKPDEVHSDSIRKSVIKNYNETIKQRGRSPNIPYIFIGQRLHEDDIAKFFINSGDGYTWKHVILKAIDEAGNSIHPLLLPKDKLLIEENHNEYVYSSQYQQEPLPSGGGLFKKNMFYIMDKEPEILSTFITVDTSETSMTYNDATVFSFWGSYKICHFGEEINMTGIHWLDCMEIWIEPKDLLSSFTQFYSECMRHRVKPSFVGIEKKSTGVCLISFLKDMQGINVIDIQRNRSSGSKSDRFIKIQPYISRKQISFTEGSKHSEMCIEHMSKITANNTHRKDDIADTCYDAVDLVLMRNIGVTSSSLRNSEILNRFRETDKKLSYARGKVW